MPSNPQVPREVAEAKGKGAGAVAIQGLSLVAIGFAVILVLVNLSSSSSDSNPTPTAQALVANQRGTYPICGDAKDVFFDPDHCVRLVKVPMRPQCWSGWISTPIEWGWESDFHPAVDMLFLDGSHVYVPDGTHPAFADQRGVFRVRGEGAFTVRITNGPMERERKRTYEEAIRTGLPADPVYRNMGDAIAGRPYVDPCGKTNDATMIASTNTSATTAASPSSSYTNPIHEEIVTIVATNFLENFMTVQNENGERNINPHNNPLYVKAPNGAWQFSMWWNLEAGDKIRLVWNGDELKRMELVENVRNRRDEALPSAPPTNPQPHPRIAKLMLAEVVEINPLENFIVVQTDDGRREIHPHNAPLYVKAANGSWQMAMISSLEAGDKVRLVWRDEDPSELRRIELVENVRTANRQ